MGSYHPTHGTYYYNRAAHRLAQEDAVLDRRVAQRIRDQIAAAVDPSAALVRGAGLLGERRTVQRALRRTLAVALRMWQLVVAAVGNAELLDPP